MEYIDKSTKKLMKKDKITLRVSNKISQGITQCAEEAKDQRPISDISAQQATKESINCSCRWKNCKRHGKCEECIAHHSQHAKYPLPSCMKKLKLKNKQNI
jgi:hypothetical protein